jgi:S-adenosylmethionine hydrolase
MNSIVTLTTDFGLYDPFVGIMKGVMLGINPAIRFIDISHQIEPQNIIQAYYILNFSYKYFPLGTIHVSVVDPGVGSTRRAILVESKDCCFVGPDNGIFSFIFTLSPFTSKERDGLRVIELTETKFFLPSVSHTFHGRDIFASVAAHLTRGVNPLEFGKPIHNPVTLNIPEPDIQEGKIQGEVIYIDRFGNLITNVSAPYFYLLKGEGKEFQQIFIKNLIINPPCKSYSDAEDLKPSSLFNSWGLLEIFIKNSNAGRELGVKKGEGITIITIDKIR